MSQPTIELTSDQIEFYHREGYLVIPDIATSHEIERMRGIYDDLFARRVGREEGNQFDLAGTDEDDKEAGLPQILAPSRYAPELKQVQFATNALAIARQLLGSNASAMGDHAILKPPFHGAATPWHQDEAYWSPDWHYNSFSMWLPLQDATLDNGCLQFVPGSHRLEVLPHHSIGNNPKIHGLEVDEADVDRAVACPISAGTCTVHHNRTLHYAGPNNSPVPRRAYILGFGIAGVRRTTPRSFPWNDAKQTPRQERAKQAELAAPSTLE